MCICPLVIQVRQILITLVKLRNFYIQKFKKVISDLECYYVSILSHIYSMLLHSLHLELTLHDAV